MKLREEKARLQAERIYYYLLGEIETYNLRLEDVESKIDDVKLSLPIDSPVIKPSTPAPSVTPTLAITKSKKRESRNATVSKTNQEVGSSNALNMLFSTIGYGNTGID